MMYLLKFAGGLEKKVSDDYADKVDKMWGDGKKHMLRFKNGDQVLLSTMTEMIRLEEGSASLIAIENTKRISGLLNSGLKKEKRDWWKQKIAENQERIKNGLFWIYYDRDGNVCSKEQARISFGIDNLNIVQPPREKLVIYTP